MNNKTIVLADSSYTIRRIVELSFSEEEGIELISFENGSVLKTKLFELKPAVVLVDIKLPEINGYEICRFINTTPQLKNTKVFLMKGGFEPIDEKQLASLKYSDIITKPFDSNALVSSIQKVLEDMPRSSTETEAEISTAAPDDIPDIDDIGEVEEDISFADIKEEIDTNNYIKEEVLPSEEITQGSQPEKEDKISTPEEEEIENPFKNDQTLTPPHTDPPHINEDTDEADLMIKQNIRNQEKELEIGSITMEAMNIKKSIDNHKKYGSKLDEDVIPPINTEADNFFGNLDDDLNLEPIKETADTQVVQEIPEEDNLFEESSTVESSVPSLKDLIGQSEPEQPEPEQIEPEHKVQPNLSVASDDEIADMNKVISDLEEHGDSSFMEEISLKDSGEILEDSDESPDKLLLLSNEEADEEITSEDQRPLLMQEDKFMSTPTSQVTEKEFSLIDEFPSILENPLSNHEEDYVIPSPSPEKFRQTQIETTLAPLDTDISEEQSFEDLQEDSEPLEELNDFQPPPSIKNRQQQRPVELEEEPTLSDSPASSQLGVLSDQELFKRVEGKLSIAIQEMLWEIIPPLAEKIIKAEIKSLKSKLEQE